MDSQKTALLNDFLSVFEVEWSAAMDKLNCHQKQLLIGSRLRPQIVLWGYLAGANWNSDIDTQSVAYLAVSIELIHKASLLLDDWIDADAARHGENAFHVDCGEHITVMTAMNLVAESIHRLMKLQVQENTKLEALNLIVGTAQSMATGALAELSLDSVSLFDLNTIKLIAQLETSEIIGNSLLVGYLLSGQNNGVLMMYLKRIGDLCGYIFQAMNDLESFSDAIMNREHKGKQNFDFDRNRKNIVIAYMYNILSGKDQKIFVNANVEQVIVLYKKYRIKKLVIRETELAFDEMQSIILSTTKHGAMPEWVEGYTWFINMLKEAASQRLS